MKAVPEKIKDKHISGFADVKVSAALTHRHIKNTSLYRAEQVIKVDPKLMCCSIGPNRTTGRGIYVDSVTAFLQKERHDPKGTFEDVF